MNPSPHTRALPGDAAQSATSLAAMLRVNHAGEYGATRIYAGQLAVLKNHPLATELRHMAAQEDAHLAAFNRLLAAYRVRPTALQPLWHIGGFLLGVGTALLGPRAAMACTAAVETIITEHYDAQLAQPEIIHGALRDKIKKFRDEEMQHRDTALQHDAEQAPAYALLTTAIQAGCRAAIWLATRI